MHKGRWMLAMIALFCGVTGLFAAASTKGPGMTVTYNSTIIEMDVNIESARSADGAPFPHAGGLAGPTKLATNPLNSGKTMGAAPDGRQLPDYIDFEWRESPKPPPDPTPKDPFSQAHKDWENTMMAEFYTHPIKKQRVSVRSRVPDELVRAVIEANRNSVRGQGANASIAIYFIWTDYGIKLRWKIWHTPAFNGQYFSNEGGDEIVPPGTTVIAAYSHMIKGDGFAVCPYSPEQPPRLHPASSGGLELGDASLFGYTEKAFSGGEKPVAFGNGPTLPEWVDFHWRLFPNSIPRKSGESDVAYTTRTIESYRSLTVNSERIQVRSRVPQDVQDEIAAATRNIHPHKASDSVIYLYFVWTESGIKLHWRLKRSRSDGSFVNVREGGDEPKQAVAR